MYPQRRHALRFTRHAPSRSLPNVRSSSPFWWRRFWRARADRAPPPWRRQRRRRCLLAKTLFGKRARSKATRQPHCYRPPLHARAREATRDRSSRHRYRRYRRPCANCPHPSQALSEPLGHDMIPRRLTRGWLCRAKKVAQLAVAAAAAAVARRHTWLPMSRCCRRRCCPRCRCRRPSPHRCCVLQLSFPPHRCCFPLPKRRHGRCCRLSWRRRWRRRWRLPWRRCQLRRSG